MIVMISPARTIQPRNLPGLAASQPLFLQKTRQLAALLREYAPWQLEAILKTNPKLAMQAWESYQGYSPSAPGGAALLTYRGLVYSNLAPEDFTRQDYAFATDHLRILSAFYGVLRPGDTIHPYRLELVSKLKVEERSLYRFWGDSIYKELFSSGQPVLNLCSAEYSKTVRPFLQPKNTFVTCDFLMQHKGKLRCIVTSAKACRGRMARYVLQNRITQLADIQKFDYDGYEYVPELSDSTRYTFVRP